MQISFILLLFIFHLYLISASFTYYINKVTRFLGYKENTEDEINKSVEKFIEKIPYEVSVADEKFISEAVKLTGVSLSELDSCQQRVVLKLKVECQKMNDEQLAKMAVHLLNCQSYVEGRKVYPCTDEMSIKECTMAMDSDTWTSYHLMSNRARAVCYMIRQTQFRGLAEHTVNRLMDTSREQLHSLQKIFHNQENIRTVAEDTFERLSKAHKHLSEQQKDIQKAQFHGQLILETNIMKLADEKKLIQESHLKLVEMTQEIRHKLEDSLTIIQKQGQEIEYYHKDLLVDITTVQSKAEDLFSRIDTYSDILFRQNEDFQNQFKSTLLNLQEVNRTIYSLLTLVGNTKQALEGKLSWVMEALGGTDQAVDKLFIMLWHGCFILIGMVTSAFLSANRVTRVMVFFLPPLNLALALNGYCYLDFITLLSVIIALVGVQLLVVYPSINYYEKYQKLKSILQPEKNSLQAVKEILTERNNHKNYSTYVDDVERRNQFDGHFSTLTPPFSRNENRSSVRSRSATPFSVFAPRGSCGAVTRAGTPCKLSAIQGRDFCYKHQNGDSVMG
ncbi:protein brambleberry-like isoform X2 [Rhynchophorus ferrugineus]|uniref:protein brambleberry-like isoform X2 n=1 Tax=Rhynchophorus ferrugineus TaxID=354439 RepID=UPI003FCDF4A0